MKNVLIGAVQVGELAIPELHLSHGEEMESVMYRVAKWNNDDKYFVAFIHNQNKASSKYGVCFAVSKDGKYWGQFDEAYYDGICEYHPDYVMTKVSGNPGLAKESLLPFIQKILSETDR